MKYLETMRREGFSVTWQTVVIGFDGPGKFSRLLDGAEICQFAQFKLADDSHPSADLLAIASASGNDTQEFEKHLRRLAADDPADPRIELRKWRLVLLEEALAQLPEDPRYALLALTEFWERFDYPSDSPHVVQGRDSETTPQDYFNETNFRRLMRSHHDWIAKETSALLPTSQ